VGAVVTINGLAGDDLMGNNATSFFTPVKVNPAPLPAPAWVAASDGVFKDRVRVTWAAVPHANAYDVYRAGSPLGAKSLLGSASGTGFDDVFVPSGKTYTYWVRALNDFTMSGFGASDTGYVQPSIAVGSPIAGEICRIGRLCDISWAYRGAIGPYVSISLLRSNPATVTILAARRSSGMQGVGSFAWRVPPNLAAGSYRVRVTSLANPQYAGTGRAFTISRDLTPPSVPANAVAQWVAPAEIDVQWGASTDNVAVDHYRIYRDGLYLAAATDVPYADTTVTPNGSYCYEVSAVDTAGNESARSNQAWP
jgi:chitodextrinase